MKKISFLCQILRKKINYQVAAKLAAKAVLNINSNINKL